MINPDDNLRKEIRKYVDRGGRDAFAFSIKYRKDYGNTPGNEIQRMIDEEYSKNRKGV